MRAIHSWCTEVTRTNLCVHAPRCVSPLQLSSPAVTVLLSSGVQHPMQDSFPSGACYFKCDLEEHLIRGSVTYLFLLRHSKTQSGKISLKMRSSSTHACKECKETTQISFLAFTHKLLLTVCSILKPRLSPAAMDKFVNQWKQQAQQGAESSSSGSSRTTTSFTAASKGGIRKPPVGRQQRLQDLARVGI